MERKIAWTSFIIAAGLVFLMWAVFLLDYTLHLDLYRFGTFPQKPSGLVGILTSPFIHSTRDFSHILSNTTPTFVLSWLLFYHYRNVALQTFLLIYFLTGIGVWLLARENYHIGMSGVIYGLSSYLVISGFFRRNLRVAGISLLVIFLYGSIIWGIFPQSPNVSWEGHALGLFSGIIAAVIFRQKGPQPVKYQYELEEELGIEPEEEYWRPDYHLQKEEELPVKKPPLIYYEFVPKEMRIKPPKEEE